jgi:putative glutamine amidotransferase
MVAMTGRSAGSRPVIGLSTYREQAAWTVWNMPADLLPSVYTRSVEAAGGVVMLLPPQAEGASEVMARLDGLIISGGPDVDPERYGQQRGPRTVRVRRDRDAWELALLDAAEKADLPTLGICRGMQLMAVRTGGRLEQHLPDVVGHDEHAPDTSSYGWTAIRTAEGSLVRQLVGDNLQVSCHHHQAVIDHPGFEVTARAADGTIEAMEDPERPFWLGVQWHPESGDDHGLFLGLVEAAAKMRVDA